MIKLPKKIILFISALAIILVILLFLQLDKSGQRQKLIDIPIFRPGAKTILPQVDKFRSTSGPAGRQPISVAEGVNITFSKPVALGGLQIAITPEVVFTTEFSDNFKQMTIQPVPLWKYDTTYIVKISKETRSADNQTLDKDYTFTFRVLPFSGI